jgi:galactokinase
MEMALLCKQAENDYVGLKSGLMDQFSVAHGVAGHALALDTRSLDWQTLRLPPDTSVVIADSAQRRKLTESGYNKRKQECSDALQILRSWCSDLASWRDVDPSFLEAHLAEMPTDIGKRAQHVVGEIQRVQQGCKCLEAGDAQGFGELMFASHSSLKELYEVSSFELDSLVEVAASLPGCLGARLTGAGFGGCTVNLVQKEFAPEFIEQLSNQYTKKTGLIASVFECFASDGARLLND